MWCHLNSVPRNPKLQSRESNAKADGREKICVNQASPADSVYLRTL